MTVSQLIDKMARVYTLRSRKDYVSGEHMNQFNVGIVGCGRFAGLHCQSWRHFKNVNVMAVCDIDEGKAASFARQWKIPHYSNNIKGMLAKVPLSAVSIVTPTSTHAALAIEAMENGCHVLIEKPLCTSLQEADRLLEISQRTQRKLSVIHNFIFTPEFIKARSLLQHEAVQGVDITICTSRYDPHTLDKNHWSHQEPGGRFREYLSHPVYMLTPFLGRELFLENVSVGKTGELPWMPIDNMAAVLRSKDGKVGIIHWFGDAPIDQVVVNVYGSSRVLRILPYSWVVVSRKKPISGDSTLKHAWLMLNEAYQMTLCLVKVAATKLLLVHRSNPHEVQIAGFMESITSGHQVPIDPLDVREELRLELEIVEQMDKYISIRSA